MLPQYTVNSVAQYQSQDDTELKLHRMQVAHSVERYNVKQKINTNTSNKRKYNC